MRGRGRERKVERDRKRVRQTRQRVLACRHTHIPCRHQKHAKLKATLRIRSVPRKSETERHVNQNKKLRRKTTAIKRISHKKHKKNKCSRARCMQYKMIDLQIPWERN